MAASLSEAESQIVISSDTNNSPERRSSDIEHKIDDKCDDKNKSIIISDTELEEGEIDDDETETIDQQKDLPKIENESRVSLSHSYKVNEDKIQKDDIESLKRKLNDKFFFEMNKKSKTENSFKELYESNVDEKQSPSFPWSELKMLVAGDERVVSLNWEEWEKFPEQDLYHVQHCNLESLCSLAEKHLYKEYDVVLLLSFHYDFICFSDEQTDKAENNENGSVIDLKSDVNINGLLKTVKKFHKKWENEYPNTYVIWTIPFPPDFYNYNSLILKEKGFDPDRKLLKKVQYELSKDYFSLTKKFVREWKAQIDDIPHFSLSKVLFMKKHCYKRSFSGGSSSTPKFPQGYLKDGFNPSKMMAVYCGYLFVEYLVDNEFFPENKFGLNLSEAEKKLLELYPEAASYVHSADRYSSHKKSNKYSRHNPHHRGRRKHDSGSPSPPNHRSESRSSRNRSWSGSRHRHKWRSKSQQDHGTRSRSSSGSSSVKKTSQSKRHSHTKKSHKRRHQSHLSTPSSSDLSEDALSSEDSLSSEKTEKPVQETKGADSKDEVAFFKTLRYLRDVHEIQCAVFRKKPHTHPQYKTEKEKFFKNIKYNLNHASSIPKWEDYWKKKMETIFEETWASKKQQLTTDLNKKVSFKSFHCLEDGSDKKNSSNNNALHSLEKSSDLTTNSNNNTVNDVDRYNFKMENAETIKSYLSELTEISEPPTVKPKSHSELQVGSKEFTLADIFQDSVDDNKRGNNIAENKSVKDPSNSVKLKSDSGTLVLNDGKDKDASFSSDSDLDVDGLMENPDFLQGLEEIDRELQNAAPQQNENAGAKANVYEDDLSSIFKSDGSNETSLNEDQLKIEFVNVLKMLFRVSKRLGPLGPSVSALYQKACESLRNKEETFAMLRSDSKALLILVDNKLNLLLKESLPQVQKAIYGEISERLQSLLHKINIDGHDKFSKVNVDSIAVATRGQQVSEVVAFIKNTLLYHGYSQFTSDDVMNIYMSVKASQLDMEKS